MIEEVLFLRWGMGVDPKEPASKGIRERVEKTLSISDTTNYFVKQIRKRALKKVLRDFVTYKPEQTIKGLAPKEGVRGTTAVQTSNKALNKFAEKVIKGLEYKLLNRFVERDRKVQIYYAYAVQPKMDQYFEKWAMLMIPTLERISLGLGFVAEYAVNKDFPQQVLYKVKIWNHIEFWGLVF